MTRVVVLDCEYLTKEGAMGRMLPGFDDPDPIVVQIGAVLLDIEKGAEIVDNIKLYIKPLDRDGATYQLDPYFTDLTGVSDDDLSKKGVDLATGLEQLDTFTRSADLWSWGKDELIALGVSGFLRGIAPPMAATRFGNLKYVLRRAGMSVDDIRATSSGESADFYGVGDTSLSKHDALDDALSLASPLRDLVENGSLSQRDFRISELSLFT